MKQYKIWDRVRVNTSSFKDIGYIHIFLWEDSVVVISENGIYWVTLKDIEPIDTRTPKRWDWVLVKDNLSDRVKRIFLYKWEEDFKCVAEMHEKQFKQWKDFRIIDRKYMKPLEEEPIEEEDKYEKCVDDIAFGCIDEDRYMDIKEAIAVLKKRFPPKS